MFRVAQVTVTGRLRTIAESYRLKNFTATDYSTLLNIQNSEQIDEHVGKIRSAHVVPPVFSTTANEDLLPVFVSHR